MGHRRRFRAWSADPLRGPASAAHRPTVFRPARLIPGGPVFKPQAFYAGANLDPRLRHPVWLGN